MRRALRLNQVSFENSCLLKLSLILCGIDVSQTLNESLQVNIIIFSPAENVPTHQYCFHKLTIIQAGNRNAKT
jgi:hypothetical protein